MSALLLIEWAVVLGLQESVEILRLAMVGIVPLALELGKEFMLKHPWPKRLASNLLYGLFVEMVRYGLVVFALFAVTSFAIQEKVLYAMLYCGNFFAVVVVNTIVKWEK